MNTLRTTLRIFLSFLMLVLPYPVAAASQVAALEGTVVDQNGVALPGVSITIKSTALLGTRAAVSDAAGRFRFPALPPGVYSLTAALSGFSKIEKDILVAAGRTANLPLTMNVSVKEEVVVTGEAPAVDITRTTVGASTNIDTIQKLPLARNYVSIATAAPGPTSITTYGATGLENQYLIDGVNTTGVKIAGTVGIQHSGPGQSVAVGHAPNSVSSSWNPAQPGWVSTQPAPPPASKPAPGYAAFTPLPVLNAKPFPDMFFRNFGVNPTVETEEEAVSTFSASVDTASYTLARSYLNRGALPDPDGVRVEDFVNFFDYRYAPPRDGAPFSVNAEAFPSPNRKGYHVLHLGLKGREVASEDRKPATLVFCIDVSGSMDIENRLGLVKRALRMLVNELDERDRVGIVVYGTNARVLLEPVNATQKALLLGAIDQLRAEGSTNTQDGILEAYRMAGRVLRRHQTNRVILCTDGVANNGVTDADGIFAEVKSEATRGIELTAVGFGMGNFNDVLLERLAQIGHGNYAYVDRLEEARRIFVTQLGGTLQTIAKDVKIQVEFDPQTVSRYRLLGFESRPLTKEEFHNDRVDAGNIGAGHAVTALYEVKLRRASPSRLGTLRIRYKDPEGTTSHLLEKTLQRQVLRPSIDAASSPAKLSFLAASFAEKLRGSYWVRNLRYDDILALFDGLGDAWRERPDVGELQGLVAAAKARDGRGDRFETMVPIAQMDFDRVPVLR